MINRISPLSRIFLFLSSVLLVVSIFVPIWRIELDAPQYPEGLMMQIHASKIAGDVEIINGLNHYIGMQTLHAENFIEFTVLPYILGFYALLMLIVGIVGRKKWLTFAFVAFVIFGIVSMVDFWRWEYNYGHNLDPNAAIKVPGMAYQPPLIGYKLLLNFGAYSIPDIGGWLILLCGVLLLYAFLFEKNIIQKLFKRKPQPALALLPLLFIMGACGPKQAEPIQLNSDKCDYCEMQISDGKFGAEVITSKGRCYKFDDMFCLVNFLEENESVQMQGHYVHDFQANNQLIDATAAFYVHHADFRSPMGGNLAAFVSEEAAKEFAQKHEVSVMTWNQVLEK